MKTLKNNIAKAVKKLTWIDGVMSLPALIAIAFTILEKNRMLFTAITSLTGLISIFQTVNF